MTRALIGSPVCLESRGHVAESAGSAPQRYSAKVGQCDRLTKNGTIYPRSVWQRNLPRLKELCKQGRLTGTIDHLDNRSLTDTAIIWRDVTLDDDGSVYGSFSLVEGHPKADILQKQIEAGVCVGFSTIATQHLRPVTAAERTRYRVPEGKPARVLGDDADIFQIDAVCAPAVVDALLVRESAPAGAIVPDPEDECGAAFEAYFASLRENIDLEVPAAVAQFGQPGAPAPERDERDEGELTVLELNERIAASLDDGPAVTVPAAFEAYAKAHRKPVSD